MSSPERGSRYEDPYYSQYASRSGSITPVIDEEIRYERISFLLGIVISVVTATPNCWTILILFTVSS
jgi:hypothetical protein